MNKRLIVNPLENKAQDLAGLNKYFTDLGYDKKITVTEKPDHLEIVCPENFVNPLISLVEKYGYWASEIQDVAEAAN